MWNELNDVNSNNWMYRNFNLPTKNTKHTKSISRTLALSVGFWLFSQNQNRRNRFVYNPNFEGINELITFVIKLFASVKMTLWKLLQGTETEKET